LSKKILIAASNYWSSPYQVGSHHYARIFAKKGWQVLFVSDPISPFHFFLKDKDQLKERYRIYKGIGKNDNNIKIYVPMAFITPNEKPIFRTGIIAKKWHRITFPDLIRYVKKIGFGKVDLLWFDSIIQHFWIKEIKHDKSILRVADRIDSFKKINSNLKKIESTLMESVDHIIYTAETLKTYVSNHEEKISHVSNGVNFEHFRDADRSTPEDLKNIPKPIAVYVGAIEDWFDVDLLYGVALKRKSVSFVIIGSPAIDLSKVSKLSNIFILGRKEYRDIPAFLYNSDIGIIPFKLDHPIVDSINPIKLYEYMACGLPVVASRWKELEMINSPAYLAESEESFLSGLDKYLRNYNKEESIEFSRSNSWESRYLEINKLIGS
jgi:glycosyltransferase involved in cell wall biosynthesis